MKNISRRVFIKGLAVAGVAAAASTVLAGCNTNMLPDVDNGTDEPSEETPAKNEAMVYTVGGDSSKTLTITAGEPVVLGTANTIVIPFTIDNKSGKAFVATAAGTATAGKFVVGADAEVTVDFDGDDAFAAASSADFTKNMFITTGTTVATGKKETHLMYITDVPTVWNKLKVTFKLQAQDGNKVFIAKEGEFNFTNK